MPFGWGAAIGGGLSAVGSIASGLIGSSASSKAADQQAAAQQAALDLQTREFNTTQQNITPWLNSGTNALQQYNNLLGIGPNGTGNPVSSNPFLTALGIGGPGSMGSIDPTQFTGSPGYQYALQQGQNAITNSMGAGRSAGGGNQLMALQKNAEGLANQNYGNWLSNVGTGWQQLLTNIGNQSNLGLSAAGTLAGDAQNYANAAGGNIANIGNANAAGTIGSANALTGGFNNALTSLSNPTTLNALASLFGNGNGGDFSAASNASAALGPVNNSGIFSPSYGYGGVSPSA